MKWQEFKKHLMTGISFMIPMVVAGGILGALAKGLGGYTIGSMGPEAGATAFSNLNAFNWTQYWWAISKLSDFAMSFVCGVLAAGIAYSMADRPGIVPAFIIGYTANQAKAGFLGAMLMAYIVGVIVLWMEKWKLPKALQGLMPVLIIPVLATLISGSLDHLQADGSGDDCFPELDSESVFRLSVYYRCCYRCLHGLRYGRPDQQDCFHGSKCSVCG